MPPEDALPYPAMPLAEAHRRLTAPGSPFELTQAEIGGETMRVWKNAPPTLREVFLMGRAHGEKTFLVCENERAIVRGLRPRKPRIRPRASESRNRQGRPGRYRHAQSPGMAGLLLRRNSCRRRRRTAQRLGHGAGTGICAQRFRRARRFVRRRAFRAVETAFRRLPGAAKRNRQPGAGAARPRPRGSFGDADRPVRGLGEPAGLRAAGRRPRRRTTTRRCSTLPAPPASRRARSARIATSVRPCSRDPMA